MQIDPTKSVDYLNGINPPNTQVQCLPKAEALADFKDAEALTLALQNENEVRDAEVEKALNSIGQVQWPPAETIRRIANLMAANINSPRSN